MLTLSQVRQQAAERGFTHVLTYGGPVPLGEWTPYGNGIERRWVAEWVAEDKVQDAFRPELTASPVGMFLGIWTFTADGKR